MDIKVYNNIFKDEYETFEYDTSKPLLEQLEEHIEKDTYKQTLVECYDSETGETFYAPMIDEEVENTSVIILADGRMVDKTYEPKEGELVSIVFFPASNIGGAVEKTLHIAASAIAGAVTGIVVGAMMGGLVGAIVVGIAGLLIGLVAGIGTYKAKEQKNLSKQTKAGKEGTQQPDVRGAENSSLRGNNFPFVVGKHLVTPFIVGDPVTEYSGRRGVDAYIRMLLCVGYAPLKLTDFKLGEFWLAYNRSHKIGSGATITKDTLLTGMLKGYSYGGTPDNGDILDYWKNNDISLEILQQPNETGEDVTIDEVYQEHTTIDLANRPQISAADLQAAGWTEATGTQTLYAQSYTSYDTANPEKAIETVLVTPILSDGTILSPSQTEEYAEQLLAGETIAVDILLFTFTGTDSPEQCAEYALGLEENQEAFYNQEHFPSGVRYGKIYPYAANDQTINANVFFIADEELNTNAQVTYKGTSFPNMFRTNGVWFTDSCPRKFTVNISFPSGLYASHTQTYTTSESSTTDVVYTKMSMWVCAQWRIYNQNNASSDAKGYDYNSWNNLDFGYTKKLSTSTTWPTSLNPYAHSTACYDVQDHKGNKLGPVNKLSTYQNLYQGFLEKNLQNFENLGGEDSISEVRLSATVTLTDQQIEQLMADTNPGHVIEIRILRVSPNYINQVSDIDYSGSGTSYGTYNDGMESYSDHLKVISVVTESFDEETYIKTGEVVPVRPLKDEDYRKLCLVAIKAKADASGYLINQLSQVNCIAESFSPYWDYETNKIMPENVFAVRKYYGYFDENNNRVNRSTAEGITEREVTRAEYEQARQDGFNWDRQDCGSNYSSAIRRIIFTDQVTHNGEPGYKLTQDAAKYNNNSVASGFMLGCVGPQNGPIGLGYENVNLLSIGDWALKTRALKDGTTANRNMVYNGVTYHKGDEIAIRMEANGYVYAGQKMEDLLQKLAFAGRAVWCADENGRIKVVMDGPVDYPVGVINAQNCITSSNTFSYEELPAGYLISFSDENDGYETNQFYVWADGNNEKNYHGQVNPLSVDFVTNNYQMWSLGRYILATVLQTREILTRKIGIEGNLFKLGDVVLVQSEDLLIGDCSGRVQEVLEDNGLIYGFICDSPYEYKAEQSSDDDYSTQGVTVLQPGYAGKSNAVTLPISMPQTVQVGERVFTLEEGTTNLVLFGQPVEKGSTDTSATNTARYNIKTSNICMFGLRDKISAPYKITKIKPEKDGCFTETLVPYNEDVYQAGEQLPSFQNYITPPEVVEPPITLSEGPSSVSEQQTSLNSVTRQINNLVNGHYAVEPPDVVTNVTATAERDGIRIVWEPLPDIGMKNVIKHYTVHISKDRGVTWDFSAEVKDSEYYYAFVRSGQGADGYPEASSLADWRIKISSVNIYGRPAETPEDPPNYSAEYEVALDNYGTWIIPSITDVSKEVVDRTVVLTAVYGQLPRTPLYGNIRTNVRIKLIGNNDSISSEDHRTFNSILCVHQDDNFMMPEFDKRVSRIDSLADYNIDGNTEENYKKNTQFAYSSLTNKITHTLPLVGQNPRMFRFGNIPITKKLEVTPSPTDNPQAKGWYVLVDGVYVLTTDTTVVAGTTYYADYSIFSWEVQDVAEMPANPSEGDLVHYIGNNVYYENSEEVKYAKNAYYLYAETTTPGTYNWEEVFAKSMAVPTEYHYEFQMVNEAGSTNAKTVSVTALPTNIADIVHSHEHYKDLYVEKLSAITANVGLIQQGGMGSFADKLNYWALSNMTAEESGVSGGVRKGAFRVGGESQYFKVTPKADNPNEYEVELRAGSISLSSNADREGFINGTYIYNGTPETSLKRMRLSSNGIVVEKRPDTTYGWSDNRCEITLDAEVIIDERNNLIITNAPSQIPIFGHKVQGSIYHFDTDATKSLDENGNNSQGIVVDGSLAQNKDEDNPILYKDSSPYSLEGTVTQDISQFTGRVVLLSKSDNIKIGNKILPSGEDFLDSEDYNALMSQTSGSTTIGEYLGLSAEQIASGIFTDFS